MVGENRLLGTLSKLVKRTRADGVSVCAHASTRRVFRFANDAIHQNIAQETVSVSAKIIRDGRIGVASSDTFDLESLTRSIRAACHIASHTPKQPDLPDLPKDFHNRTTSDYVPATVQTDPITCVQAIRHLTRICQGVGVMLAGSLTTGEDELAVVNSSGVSSYTASTIAGAKLVTTHNRLSGFASGVHRRFDKLDLQELLRRAMHQCLHKQEPLRLPLGTYEVILEPEAVAELLDWLGSIAFSAKSVQERTSCLAGRMGEQLMNRKITIYDDAMERSTLRMPFDFEGTPKSRTVLIDRGKAAGIVYDSIYGKRFGQPSTGHAMPPDEPETGPQPLHLAIAPGKQPKLKMISSCKRGLLIPRFHYVNGLLNPRQALMTGLLREGVFLIENGELTFPVATMRFTQNLLEAWSRILGISKERRLVADSAYGLGGMLVPALHLAAFTFTGRSET